MLGWNTIAKFLFLWILAVLIKDHHEFMKKKNNRWPFRKRKTAA